MANASYARQTTSGSDVDEKKRKRKLSNRESARRSRLKKQKLMEDTIHEISTLQLRIKENNERCKVMKQRLDAIESENALLKSEKKWLSSYFSDLEAMMGSDLNAETMVGDCRHKPLQLSPMASFGLFKT